MFFNKYLDIYKASMDYFYMFHFTLYCLSCLHYMFHLTLTLLSGLLPLMLLWGLICGMTDSSAYSCLPLTINMFIWCLTSKRYHDMAHDSEQPHPMALSEWKNSLKYQDLNKARENLFWAAEVVGYDTMQALHAKTCIAADGNHRRWAPIAEELTKDSWALLPGSQFSYTNVVSYVQNKAKYTSLGHHILSKVAFIGCLAHV